MSLITKNQKGISLVEALVAMGITAAAGVAYMTHVQTVSKNEAAQKVRQSLTLIESQANEYLQSREICNDNISKAFDGVAMSGDLVQGNADYHKLQNKGFKNANNNVVQTSIFDVDQNYDGGRIWVKDVNYEMKDLKTIVIKDAPWNTAGTLNISVEFEYCSTGGLAYLASGGGKQKACKGNIINRKKIFTKMAAFKLGGDGKIEKKPVKVYNASKQDWEATGEEKLALACADSQDSLVEAANEYTKKQICLLEAKMMAKSGIAGNSSCGWKVDIAEKTESSTFHVPDNIIPNSLRYKLVGGGGGGGGSDNIKPGDGGKAGVIKEGILTTGVAGKPCQIVIGAGGSGGDRDKGLFDSKAGSGESGKATKLICGDGVTIEAPGGYGGCGECLDKDIKSGNSGEASIFAAGGNGGSGCDNLAGSDGMKGSGGGGAGSKLCWGADSASGGRGGNGQAEVSYKIASITDDEGKPVSLVVPSSEVIDVADDNTPVVDKDPTLPKPCVAGKMCRELSLQ